jgi:hypothetical protein
MISYSLSLGFPPRRSPAIALSSRLSFLPPLQVRPIAIERIVVHVKDARVARALTAIFPARAYGRHGPQIVILWWHGSVLLEDFRGDGPLESLSLASLFPQ